MKRTASLIAAAAFIALISASASAQSTAQQTVNLSVSAVQLIAVSSGSVTLSIDGSAAVAGTDAIGTASDNSTNYSITHNNGTTLRVTAQLDAAMPTGTALTINLANSSNGTSAGTIDISDGTAKDVVTSIAAGIVSAESISYGFSADASAGQFSGSRTVTLTLTN